MGAKPRKLATSLHPKVWGSRNLAPWYPAPDEPVGEVWFEADLPLLVKFIFTSDRLSVQVHPGGERGKTEMWHILRADPGARIALGFRESITPQRLKEAARSGEIVDLLNWLEVKPGETYFTPAGTVHAIGAGLALCEIQQHSDITYRLYDYGRPRELHLDKAIAVTDMHATTPKPVALPVECRYFRTEAFTATKGGGAGHFELLIVLEGTGRIAGEPYRAGETWLVPEGAAEFPIQSEPGTRMLRSVPHGSSLVS